MPARLTPWLIVILLLIALSGCGGGNSNGTPGHGDPVTITPKTASLLVLSQGAQYGVQQFQAVVQGANSSAVDWLVNGIIGGSATVGSISSNGLYTVPDEVPAGGSVTVTARSQLDPTQTDSATVTLRYPVAQVGRVAPDEVQVGSGVTVITIAGLQFSRSAVAYLAGNPLPTIFISHKQLTTTLPASTLSLQNTLYIGVKNPPPGGGGTDGTDNKSASVFVVSGTFVQVGDLNVARESHAATLLQNGKVLVTGGSDASGTPLSSAEIFDPLSNTFQVTGSMNAPRMGHSATLLPNGQVLVAGGTAAPGTGNYLQTAELYDPAAGTFSTIAQQTTYPHQNNSVLLNNNQIMLQDLILSTINSLDVAAKADIYDPAGNTFSPVPESNSPVGNSIVEPCLAAVKINTGQNLVVVGTPYFFDPGTLIYTPAGSTNFGYEGCSMTLLNDGKVFAAGGWSFTYEMASGQMAQVWDPVSKADTTSFSMPGPLTEQAATRLQSGEVLLMGGGGYATSDEIYDPARAQVFVGPSTVIRRFGGLRGTPLGRPTATTLLDGRVLVIGGVDVNNPSRIAETYVP